MSLQRIATLLTSAYPRIMRSPCQCWCWVSLALALAAAPAGCSRSGQPPTTDESRGSEERKRLDREFRALVDSYNRTTGARLISVDDARSKIQRGEKIVFLDIREPEEHAVSALRGALLLPLEKLSDGIPELPEDATLVTYCTAGYRSGLAAVELEKRLGRPVHNLDGGIIEWFNRGGEVRDPTGKPVERIHPYSDEWAKYARRLTP